MRSLRDEKERHDRSHHRKFCQRQPKAKAPRPKHRRAKTRPKSKMRKRTIAFYKIGRQMLNLYRYFSEQRLKFQFLRRLREQRCALDGCRSKPPFAVPALLGQGAKMDVTTKELSDILSLTQRQYLRSGKRRRDSQDRAQ